MDEKKLTSFGLNSDGQLVITQASTSYSDTKIVLSIADIKVLRLIVNGLEDKG